MSEQSKPVSAEERAPDWAVQAAEALVYEVRSGAGADGPWGEPTRYVQVGAVAKALAAERASRSATIRALVEALKAATPWIGMEPTSEFTVELVAEVRRWMPRLQRRVDMADRKAEEVYEALRMSGTCRNGAERDSGRRTHAVLVSRNRGWARAACGAKPGKRGNGWSEHRECAVTCPRCLVRAALAQAASAGEGGK